MFIQIGNNKLWSASALQTYQYDTLAALSAVPIRDLLNPKFKQASGSLNIHHAVDERSTCDITIIDMEGAYHFDKGQQIIINYWGDYILFGGVVETPSEIKPGAGPLLIHTIRAVDWHYLADKRRVAKAWKNTTAGQVVREIIADILKFESVSEGEILDGPQLEQVIFNYTTVAEAMDKLAEMADFIWFISEERKLYFIPRDMYAAPWSAHGEDLIRASVEVENGNPEYRNRQYILGGQDSTDTQIEYFHGDGLQRSFTVGFPIGEEPIIKVNGVDQTVGIKGVEEGFQWYWNKDSNVVTQDNAGVPLTAEDALEVDYIGLYSVIAVSASYSSIVERKAIEGVGTGIVEAVAEEPSITTRDAALNLANARLDVYATDGKIVKYKTTREGLAAGQIQTVYLPEHGVNGIQMLISSVDITESGNIIWYEVTAILGAVQDSWTKTFLKLSSGAKSYIIRENLSEAQVLIVLDQFFKNWTAGDGPNIFKLIYPGEATLPGTADWPCFAPEDRVRFVAICKDSCEYFRKPVTKVDDVDDDLISTTFVSSGEANGVQLTYIGWIGGYSATSDLNTGIIIDKQVYSRIKTDLEALQIEKVDHKNF